MTGGPTPADAAPEGDRDEPPRDPRVARTWRFPIVGLVAGLVLAAAVGLLGGDGRAGLVVVLLVTAVGCGLGALYALVTAVADDLRKRPVARARPVIGIGLFFLAAMLMAMVAAAGG